MESTSAKRVGSVLLTVVFFLVFLVVLTPSGTAWIPMIGPWLAKWGIFVAAFPLAALVWFHSSKWGVVCVIFGWAGLIFAMLLVAQATSSDCKYRVALVGSILGYLTYLPISIIGKYHDIEEARNAPLAKVYSRLDVDLDSSLKEAEEPSKNSKAGVGALLELMKINRSEYHCEPKWEEVFRMIDWPLRIMRLPMVMGIAAGLVFLGSLMNIRGHETASFGIFFLVGLYPRIFEQAFKAFADRLTGGKE